MNSFYYQLGVNAMRYHFCVEAKNTQKKKKSTTNIIGLAEEVAKINCDMAALSILPCCSFWAYTSTIPSTIRERSAHTAVLCSTTFGGQYNRSGSVPGLQIALDRINSDPTLLQGYSLHYTLTDSQLIHNCFLKKIGCKRYELHTLMIIPFGI